MTDKPPYQELYERVTKTTKNRFSAQKRLKHHSQCALWTITLSSIFLLIPPLAQAFSLKLNQDVQTINFVQILLTITILIISVALSMANFSARSERIHNCGIELNSLVRKIYPKITCVDKEDDYECLNLEYDNILKRYENHASVDFMRTKLEMASYYNPPYWYKPLFLIRYYILEFFFYFFTLAAGGVWILTLFIK